MELLVGAGSWEADEVLPAPSGYLAIPRWLA